MTVCACAASHSGLVWAEGWIAEPTVNVIVVFGLRVTRKSAGANVSPPVQNQSGESKCM